jgi:hypothetical protein
MRKLLLVAAMATVTACAAGNRYDYRSALVGIPISGGGTIAINVLEARSYVVDGNKPAAFVGLQRGGFGNPYTEHQNAANAARAFEARLTNLLRDEGVQDALRAPNA